MLEDVMIASVSHETLVLRQLAPEPDYGLPAEGAHVYGFRGHSAW